MSPLLFRARRGSPTSARRASLIFIIVRADCSEAVGRGERPPALRLGGVPRAGVDVVQVTTNFYQMFWFLCTYRAIRLCGLKPRGQRKAGDGIHAS